MKVNTDARLPQNESLQSLKQRLYEIHREVATLLNAVEATANNALPLAGGVLAGNLDFSGAARRITGDFGGATLINRLMFQSNIAAGNTRLGMLPTAASGGTAGPMAYSNTDVNNCSIMDLRVTDGAAVSLQSAQTGAGAYLPITVWTGGAERLRIDTSGNGLAGTDNTQTWGSAAKRWAVIYAGTGAINTSDAREKTAVKPLTIAEIEAAKQLSAEIGAYRFLSAIAAKGDDARSHIGMTVQRAIEVMESHGLAPFAYGFICYDEWPESIVTHEATDDAPEWIETIPAGNRYSFRPDELLFFIARGFEARLSALEAA